MIERKRIITACIAVVAISFVGMLVQRFETAAQLFGYVAAVPAVPGHISMTSASSSPTLAPLKCSPTATSSPVHTVLINEVAWAGIAHDQTTREWVELKNTGTSAVSLAGWQLLNAAESVAIFFGDHDRIESQGYYLAERGGTDPIGGALVEKSFSGAIKNSNESLRLFDRECHLIDEAVAGDAWPAGSAAPGYRTMERSADLSWHTYSGNGRGGVFGTPGRENSPEIKEVQIIPDPVSIAPPPAGLQSLSATSSRVVINEVMAGMAQNKNYQFIELYNPASTTVDLTGWTIKKKSSAGAESPLVSASRLRGAQIAAGGYFLIAKDGGYAGPPEPDALWPASYSLAYTNNTVTLYDPSGQQIDSVSWDKIEPDKSFARSAPASVVFVISDPTPGQRNF